MIELIPANVAWAQYIISTLGPTISVRSEGITLHYIIKMQ